jgi:hypothetical protein
LAFEDSRADINADEEKNSKQSNKKQNKFYNDELVHSDLKIELKKSASRLMSKQDLHNEEINAFQEDIGFSEKSPKSKKSIKSRNSPNRNREGIEEEFKEAQGPTNFSSYNQGIKVI